jgi:flagellar biosynthetic protein FlhB
MSDTNDAASRTEDPTPRRLQQARESGDVVRTQDLPSVASLLAVAGVVALGGGWFSRNLAASLRPFIAEPDTMRLDGVDGVNVARLAIEAAAPAVGAVVLAAAVAGVFGNLIQTGFLFSPERLAFDLSKLSLTQGLKRVFGLDGFAQWIKSLVKVSLTGALAWWVLQPHLAELTNLAGLEPIATMSFALDVLRRLVFAVGAFLLVVAGADWLWQRQRFMTRMRMTKEELKEDFKQSEGDPHIKARQRQLRTERARRRMIQAVPEATVVVMNPTHYAVALKYDTDLAQAPLCVAKGLDSLALKIREVAEEAGVPILEDPPLARALYATVEVDEVIPPAHYEAVAKIIGFILSAGRDSAARRFRRGEFGRALPTHDGAS